MGLEEADRYVHKSYDLLTKLMSDYHKQVDGDCVGTSSFGASSSTVSAAALSIFKTLTANKKTTGLAKSKNELDR